MTDTDDTQPQDDGPSSGRMLGHLATKLTAERAAHEETRRRYTDLDTARQADIASIEADRDRLAAQVDELTARLGQYADRGIANGQRAERAEAALTRARTVAGRLAAHAAGFQDALDDTDRGPWGKTIGADLDDLRAALGDDQSAETRPSRRCTCAGVGFGNGDCPVHHPAEPPVNAWAQHAADQLLNAASAIRYAASALTDPQ